MCYDFLLALNLAMLLSSLEENKNKWFKLKLSTIYMTIRWVILSPVILHNSGISILAVNKQK